MPMPVAIVEQFLQSGKQMTWLLILAKSTPTTGCLGCYTLQTGLLQASTNLDPNQKA